MKDKMPTQVGKPFAGLSNYITKKRAKLLAVRGQKLLAKGKVEQALECARQSLSIDNYRPRAYELMARCLMPGDDYLVTIKRFHELLKPESYVEIGVEFGISLVLANSYTKAVGIDPNPADGIKSHAKIYKMKSDEFFKSYDLFRELGVSRLALAFIDGLHHFEQVLSDFINLERYGEKETVILIHDCLPVTRLAASRVRSTMFWPGDVWKVMSILSEHRPDLRLQVIPTWPSGLGVITNLDPGSNVLAEKYEQIFNEYLERELDYDFLDRGKVEQLKAKFNAGPVVDAVKFQSA